MTKIDYDSLLYYFAVILITGISAWILTRVSKSIFKRIYDRRENLQLKFFERIVFIAIVLVCCIIGLSFLGGIDSLWKSILGGTAVISAVLIFTAQDVIKDVLAGLMISIYKPFEIGSRIELEGSLAGVVKDITMRHTVIHTWGSQEMIIPNSRLNSLIVLNDSYNRQIRSFQANFNIGYGSDVRLAMETIRKAIIESPYTIEGRDTNHGLKYDDVYFTAYEPSSLKMETTVYYNNTPTEIVKSDVNLRVNEALKKANIEIPYNYINVIQK